MALPLVATAVGVCPPAVPPAGAATFTVNQVGDSADANPADGICDASLATPGLQCTLRAAIQQANALAGADAIHFGVGTGAVTISPASALPALGEQVTVDGTTQPGFAGTPIVTLNGSAAGSTSGLVLAAPSITVRGLAIGNFGLYGIGVNPTGGSSVIEGNHVGIDAGGSSARPNGFDGINVAGAAAVRIGGTTPAQRNVISKNGSAGIRLTGSGATGVVIQGNYIGLDAGGSFDLGNGAFAGIQIENGSYGNSIGGVAAGAGNVISTNNHGIAIQHGSSNTIQGNLIGTDAAGAAGPFPGLGNRSRGVVISDSSSNTVGGTAAGAGNVISGNGRNSSAPGIEISGGGATGNAVQGNLIGTEIDGATAHGNRLEGVRITGGASNNSIGGTAAGAGNTVAFNGALSGSAGVGIDGGTGNSVDPNSIHSNGGIGIDLGGDGATANDAGDGDSGANHLQNFPDLLSVTLLGSGDLLVRYFVDSDTGSSTYPLLVELFEADSAASGEGRTFLGSDSFSTADHAAGSKSIDLGPAAALGVALGDPVVATATDAFGNSSEFSPPATVSVDSQPPMDPTSLASTSHVAGVWSDAEQLGMQWSGAADAGGSGLAGYSVRFDTVAGFTTPHAFQLQWGSNGAGAGQFQEVAGIGADSAGNIYVVDHQQHRIQVFDAGGAFLRMWGWGVDTGAAALEVCDTASLPCQIGLGGAGDGQLNRPVGLAVADSGHVYVVDTHNSRVQKFDLDGGFVGKWGSAGTGAGQLTQPHGVAVDDAGQVYVAESQGDRVQLFDADGNFVRMWGWGVDTGAGQFEICDSTTLPCQAAIAGDGAGQFDVPESLAVGPDGSVYVTDLVNQRVQVFDSAGGFVRTWGWGVDTGAAQLEVCDTTSLPCQAGIAGGGDGQFDSPEFIDLDASGSVYVSVGALHRVQKFAGDGTYLARWGSFGAGPGELHGPLGVVVGSSNSVYVSDWMNHRVQRFADPTVPDDTVDVAHGTDPHAITSAPLAEGQEHWFHLRTCDAAGNCTTTLHSGPYWIDLTDPTDPTDVLSTSHATGVASADPTIDMTWTAGGDALSGLDGYAWAFTGSATPVCDQGKDLEEGATGVSSAALASGDWWFHICTVDNAGNWTATVTAGPYTIDVSAPADPSAIASTSHAPSVWSDDPTITVEWSGAADSGGAGLAGYSFLFDTGPSTLPDATVDLAHASDPHTTTSAALADGSGHWFHLRTCDALGNCTATVHLGPFWIDTTPPRVTLVDSEADTGDGVLSEGEVSGAAITRLKVTFDEQLSGAAEVANYLLVGDASDGFQTADCAGGVDPGDVAIAVDLATWSAATLTATLDVHGGVPLFDGAYRLHACGSTSITDLAGNRLDGNGDGVAGDDFRRGFSLVDTRPTAHPGADRTIDVDESHLLGDTPAATGGTAPYDYAWVVTPDTGVSLSSTTEANPTLSSSIPNVLSAQLTVTDVNSLASDPAAAEITVTCPTRRDLFNLDFSGTHTYQAIETVTAERLTVLSGADLTLQAGSEIVLIDDVQVEADASLTIVVDPSTDCF